ncbi:hypothetical protein IQ07DRAFT_239084 [Pyrenochaeta sp. DS3sAY3a]|nr:hypothetical protein IQ07DRAFT_239084 [Pyrenochaeta sp. DS3sAY3a]
MPCPLCLHHFPNSPSRLRTHLPDPPPFLTAPLFALRVVTASTAQPSDVSNVVSTPTYSSSSQVSATSQRQAAASWRGFCARAGRRGT